jgi:hypothetical protein
MQGALQNKTFSHRRAVHPQLTLPLNLRDGSYVCSYDIFVDGSQSYVEMFFLLRPREKPPTNIIHQNGLQTKYVSFILGK